MKCICFGSLFVLMYQARGQGIKSAPLCSAIFAPFVVNLPRDTAFENTESAYDLKEMHRIVNSLPREYKVPFSMHVSGFKYREIAEKLELPLGTVKSRIFFTRQKLQQELKDFV